MRWFYLASNCERSGKKIFVLFESVICAFVHMQVRIERVSVPTFKTGSAANMARISHQSSDTSANEDNSFRNHIR